ncbi:MAG: hypothetical protein SGI77_15525 [Pirellulaceae bacterium]|nr:hypothetical protein [Pirellulaceae bacterium]
MAKAYEVTRELRYLDMAIHRAQLGVIPGQLTDGPNAGVWLDAHNASPQFHYIMMRGLTRLFGVMPADHPARDEVLNCLQLGLRVRNQEIIDRGVSNKDKAIESLLLVHSVFRNDPSFIKKTRSSESLRIISEVVSDEYRRKRYPLPPREWGLFLEAIVSDSVIPKS